jgi:hypothetical protein
MAVLADPLPDDAATLKAMLIAERARTERLTQIMKALQRHRCGGRAESLPIGQLELGLEDGRRPADRGGERCQGRSRRSGSRRSWTSPTRPVRAARAHMIGEDVAERLDIIPAQFRVLVVRRPKYGMRRPDPTFS